MFLGVEKNIHNELVLLLGVAYAVTLNLIEFVVFKVL